MMIFSNTKRNTSAFVRKTMRLWSISPGYLDPKGLVACWAEGLLAQSALTKGEYTGCPQCEGIGVVEDISNTIPHPYYCPKCKGTGHIKTPYYNHPQLERFKNAKDPVGAIGKYLHYVWVEALRRGYNFDQTKIIKKNLTIDIPVSSGQLEFELKHLLNKLAKRNRTYFDLVSKTNNISAHPIFITIEEEGMESWEKIR